MAYTPFDGSKPNGASQNGAQFGQSARDNLNALRDACIMGGGFFGWPLSVSNGTAEQPTRFIYYKGVERVRAELTWGTAGGEAGNVTAAQYLYSNDSGGTYSSIGTKAVAYDGNGNVTSTSWSA